MRGGSETLIAGVLMSVLNELKPIQKFLVMDLLEQAEFDVSQWKNYKGTRPAANPKYCYNWSFEQPGERVAVCVWHQSLKQQNGKVFFRRKPRAHASVRKGPGASVWNRRGADVEKNLELAYRQQLPIRVIVVEGEQRNPADLKPKASSVKARLLDPATWAVTEYDYATGECLLERGKKPVVPAVDSSDLELSWFEGKWKPAFVYHRRREAKARREKIRESLRANGGKLICEVPLCGFDFAKMYGALGEGYAQVHHLLPLSKSPKDGREIKLKDLAIVCANCHVMIHVGGKCRPLTGLIVSSIG
jgi:5-methylcytosine-specific restriction protein A